MSFRSCAGLGVMTTFALIHGSGDGGWAWNLVQRELRRRGHEAVAPDLPTDRSDTTWDDCVDVIVHAVGRVDDVVLVGHSSGGFVVPLAADRVGAVLQVFVAGMVPQPGESPAAWFGNLGWYGAVVQQAHRDGGLTGNPDPMVACYHDVPIDLAKQAMARERPASARLGETSWPLPALPPITARYVVTTRDRFIPPVVQRRVAAERLGISEPDEVETGHCPNLSRPAELADQLAAYVEADRQSRGT